MTKEEADLIITEQNKSTEEILKAVAKVKSDYHELCKLKDMRIAELEAQLEREKNLNQCLSDHNEQLRELIEKMKCCANCGFSESDRLNGTFCHKEGCYVLASAKCKLWEK